MRLEDEYTFKGDVRSASFYGGARDGGLRDFQRFLKRVESKPGLLPSWWSHEKMVDCVRYATNGNKWSHLEPPPRKATSSNTMEIHDAHAIANVWGASLRARTMGL